MIKNIDSALYARDVARRTQRGRRALIVKSVKSIGGEVRVESALERDVAVMLDVDPRVVEISAQPFTLELNTNELLLSRQHYRVRPGIKPRFYTPDFLCRLDDGALVAVDAKHSTFIPEFEIKKINVEAALRHHGIGFKVIPDTEVSSTVMEAMAGLHLLRADYLKPLRAVAEDELGELLDICSAWAADELMMQLTSGRIAIYAGLLAGMLTTDLATPLFYSNGTVRAAHGDLSHLQILEVRA
jgi:hypothetical protein